MYKSECTSVSFATFLFKRLASSKSDHENIIKETENSPEIFGRYFAAVFDIKRLKLALDLLIFLVQNRLEFGQNDLYICLRKFRGVFFHVNHSILIGVN